MDILLFDMDGVLVNPRGYHRALHETVRLAGISAGIGAVDLEDEQVTQFEALGISSEWHSSALCMAVMVLEKQAGFAHLNNPPQPVQLNLESLFEALSFQPMQNSALHRGVAAIEMLAEKFDVAVDPARKLVAESESIQYSPTLNCFQELILGSQNYSSIYQKESQFKIESYLDLYDVSLLRESESAKIMNWVAESGHGAAIMTNRPSKGPSEFSGMPDSEMGANLVSLAFLPLVGKGDLLWFSAQTGLPVEHFAKPTWRHAMAAILAACGWPVEECLKFVGKQLSEWECPRLQFLQDSKVSVFEDTPGGLVSVQKSAKLLGDIGIQVKVQNIGIAENPAKRNALFSQDASVYADINQALASLGNF